MGSCAKLVSWNNEIPPLDFIAKIVLECNSDLVYRYADLKELKLIKIINENYSDSAIKNWDRYYRAIIGAHDFESAVNPILFEYSIVDSTYLRRNYELVIKEISNKVFRWGKTDINQANPFDGLGDPLEYDEEEDFEEVPQLFIWRKYEDPPIDSIAYAILISGSDKTYRCRDISKESDPLNPKICTIIGANDMEEAIDLLNQKQISNVEIMDEWSKFHDNNEEDYVWPPPCWYPDLD